MASQVRRTPSADVEQALVDAAERVLRRAGPTAVTVRAVAAEAGVAPMGVYNRLGGKDGLADRLLRRGFETFTSELVATTAGDPVARLQECGRGYRRFALANPQLYRAMFEGSLADRPMTPATAEVAAGSFLVLVDRVRALIDAGLSPLHDPYAVALHVWSAVHGAVSLELRGLIGPSVAERSYEQLIDLLGRAVVTPPSGRPTARS